MPSRCAHRDLHLARSTDLAARRRYRCALLLVGSVFDSILYWRKFSFGDFWSGFLIFSNFEVHVRFKLILTVERSLITSSSRSFPPIFLSHTVLPWRGAQVSKLQAADRSVQENVKLDKPSVHRCTFSTETTAAAGRGSERPASFSNFNDSVRISYSSEITSLALHSRCKL